MTAELLRTLRSGLSRSAPIDVIEGLRGALRQADHSPYMIPEVALVLDTNAVFDIVKLDQSDKVIDYLTTKHAGPIILPGQVFTEYWNNRVNRIDSPIEPVLRALAQLDSAITKFGEMDFGPYRARFEEAVHDFRASHVAVLDPGHARKVDGALEAISAVAKVVHVPRDEFWTIGRARKSDKTPPGFRDGSDEYGDFFVWAEALFALMVEQEARAGRAPLTRAAFVTNDTKKDWSVRGSLHPVLRAEAKLLAGVEMDTWSVETLDGFISSQLSPPVPADPVPADPVSADK